MKKRIKFIFATVVVLLLIVTSSSAQKKSAENFFVGKWKIMIYGLPQGDTEMLVTFEMKEDKLGGAISTKANPNEKTIFSKVEVEDSSVTAYYTAQGYDVSFVLEKKEGEKVKGSMMDMFDMEGEKVKE